MILSCLAAVTSVLERQYQRYFQMELSGQLRRETQTARLHNFDAEQVFGMMNAAKKRAPHASYCFLSCKIRSVKNKVVDFLNSLDEEKRERIVNWAKGKARLMRSANQVRLGELRKEMINRQMKKRQQKQDKERRQVELQLQTISVAELASAFPDLDGKGQSDVTDLLEEKELFGRNVCHIWFDEETQRHDLYYGLIEGKHLRKRKNGHPVYVIAYWDPDEESYNNSDSYELTKFELAVDVVFGDLMLD